MPIPPPIFVAGTGRCGTSRIADIIGEHPLIHRIPMETRFLVDPGGLRDLADALTCRYDPTVGEDALHRLSDFLTVRVPDRRDDRGKTVPELVGGRRYRDAVHKLWPQLTAYMFDEPVPAAGFGDAARPAGPFQPPSRRRVVPRYFRDRAELIGILRGLIDSLFGGAAADAGKPTWCEKTPFNLLSMEFLWELVPEATIVHIKRHPVSVLASHLVQPWAPSTVEGALAYLEPVYRRWLTWKNTVDLTGRRYVEVKAEDLAADWTGQRRALFERLGVGDVATRSAFQAQRLTNRTDQFDAETRQFIEEALGDIIPAMGYECQRRRGDAGRSGR
ncbi:sulfotransferase family protein [Micromonospora sp. DT31]|uniref:sulfotransferase family protein n=1 Tax=Micromonospora sp. DT31 TaxID=3393434 RepID=UPI003CF5E305